MLACDFCREHNSATAQRKLQPEASTPVRGSPIATSMMRLVSAQNRPFWFLHHKRTLPRESINSHIEIRSRRCHWRRRAFTQARKFIEALATIVDHHLA